MQGDLYLYTFRVNLEQDNDLSRENRGIEKEYERYSTSASLIRWENYSRTLSSSRVHHTLSVTHGQFSRMYSNTVYYLRPRLYIYMYTRERENAQTGRARSHGRWIRYTVCSRSASARQTSSAFFERENRLYILRSRSGQVHRQRYIHTVLQFSADQC